MDIFQACEDGDLEYVRRYIDEGHDIEVREKESGWGRTPLMGASANGHRDIVKLLLDLGANIEARDNGGQTALLLASGNGHKNSVKLLLDRGANIEARDNDGYTALLLASHRGHRSVAKFLLNHGANIEAQNASGDTVFSKAFRWGLWGEVSNAQYLAKLAVSSPNIPYSGIPLSLFIPRHVPITVQDYSTFAKELIPMYMERVIKEPAFGIDMQRDIEEMLDGKTDEERKPLTKRDLTLLTKLLKTLRSVDYTESKDANGRTESKKMSQIYDMEL